MNRNKYYLFIYAFLGLSASVFASESPDMNSLSNAMFLFMGIAGVALFITYMVWRYNNSRKRSAPPQVVHRGPVRRSAAIYYRKRTAQDKVS